jgi:hypothetical protein
MFALRKANGCRTQLFSRTELQCVFCDNLDPVKIEAAKWAHSPLAAPLRLIETIRQMPSGGIVRFDAMQMKKNSQSSVRNRIDASRIM